MSIKNPKGSRQKCTVQHPLFNGHWCWAIPRIHTRERGQSMTSWNSVFHCCRDPGVGGLLVRPTKACLAFLLLLWAALGQILQKGHKSPCAGFSPSCGLKRWKTGGREIGAVLQQCFSAWVVFTGNSTTSFQYSFSCWFCQYFWCRYVLVACLPSQDLH